MTSIGLPQHRALADFAKAGGRVLVTGAYGSVNGVGCPRETPLLSELKRAGRRVRHREDAFVSIGGDAMTAVRPYESSLWNMYGGKRHSPRRALLAEVARKPFLDAVADLLPGRLSLVRSAGTGGKPPALFTRMSMPPRSSWAL